MLLLKRAIEGNIVTVIIMIIVIIIIAVLLLLLISLVYCSCSSFISSSHHACSLSIYLFFAMILPSLPSSIFHLPSSTLLSFPLFVPPPCYSPSLPTHLRPSPVDPLSLFMFSQQQPIESIRSLHYRNPQHLPSSVGRKMRIMGC